MTMQQIRWASQHDWFLSSEGVPHQGMVAVCRDYEPANGDWVETTVRFDSFSELRRWAGY